MALLVEDNYFYLYVITAYDCITVLPSSSVTPALCLWVKLLLYRYLAGETAVLLVLVDRYHRLKSHQNPRLEQVPFVYAAVDSVTTA